MRLEIDNATVGYGGRVVLADASLTLEDGEIGCLLGPSGAGKTTLLRAVASAPTANCWSVTACTCHRNSAASAWCSRTTRCCRT